MTEVKIPRKRPTTYKKRTDFDRLHHLFRRLVWRMEDIIDKVVEADEGKSLNPAEFTEGSKHSLISMLAALIDASTKLEKIKKPESQTASALPDIQVSEGDALLVRAYLERVSKKNEEPNDASLS